MITAINFKQISETVPVKDYVRTLGINIDGSGKILCPFHNDKRASMKVDKRYHCFGCGEDGDVINFVSKYFDISLSDAAIKIASEYIGPMLEFKNVFLDDDMKLSALKDTELLKKIITNNGKLTLEKKFKDLYQGYVYVKLIAFGNGSLKSLYDRSMGFYRRQIVLTAQKIPEDRGTDPFLCEKIKSEAEGILLWVLEGFYRLRENNYQFTISDSARRNIEKIMEEQDTIGAFLNSRGYVQFGPEFKASTKALYNAYCEYCDNNNLNKVAQQSFNNYLSENSEEYGLIYSKHIKGLCGVESRGYIGIGTRLEYNQDKSWTDTPQDKYYE